MVNRSKEIALGNDEFVEFSLRYTKGNDGYEKRGLYFNVSTFTRKEEDVGGVVMRRTGRFHDVKGSGIVPAKFFVKEMKRGSQKELDRVWDRIDLDKVETLMREGDTQSVLRHVKKAGLTGSMKEEEPKIKTHVYETFKDTRGSKIELIEERRRVNSESYSSAYGVRETPKGGREPTTEWYGEMRPAIDFFKEWGKAGEKPQNKTGITSVLMDEKNEDESVHTKISR